MRVRVALTALVALTGLGTCLSCSSKTAKDPSASLKRDQGSTGRGGLAAAAAKDGAQVRIPPTRYPGGPRVVAIGDVHGDLDAAERALKLAGAVDDAGDWAGGDLVVVQTGDVLDRGDDEPQLLSLFERLEAQARAAGGRFLWLNGNHEVMNVGGDFRYVSPDGLSDYGDMDGRREAFVPGGAVARILAGQPVVAIVGDSVFAHGGLLPRHTHHGEASLSAINRVNTLWMLGRLTGKRAPAALQNIDSPIWTRRYSWGQLDAARCAELESMLAAVKAKRLVVGHTVQDKGISSSCGGKVWRIDVGMSAYYSGPIQVLEIRGDAVAILGKEKHGGAAP